MIAVLAVVGFIIAYMVVRHLIAIATHKSIDVAGQALGNAIKSRRPQDANPMNGSPDDH